MEIINALDCTRYKSQQISWSWLDSRLWSWILLQRIFTPTWTKKARSRPLRPPLWTLTDPGRDPRSSSVTPVKTVPNISLSSRALLSSCRTSAVVRWTYVQIWIHVIWHCEVNVICFDEGILSCLRSNKEFLVETKTFRVSEGVWNDLEMNERVPPPSDSKRQMCSLSPEIQIVP